MSEKRRETRYQTNAKVKIEKVGKGEFFLKDISITGCRVECTAFSEIERNKQYKLKIIPEEAANIRPFDLLAETKWIGTGVDSFDIGFAIIESPHGKSFQRYVDYLSWRYSYGSSMTGGSPEIPPMP